MADEQNKKRYQATVARDSDVDAKKEAAQARGREALKREREQKNIEEFNRAVSEKRKAE